MEGSFENKLSKRKNIYSEKTTQKILILDKSKKQEHWKKEKNQKRNFFRN